jgi:DNA-binding transcriptional LysR family regulator
MHSSSWDNLKYVLSVIEAGSVSAAARDLGVNHATVLRRIAAFESQYGGPIFDKNANGYRLMPGKEALVQAVREVENGVLTVERLMQGANPLLSGVVRISSTDTISQYLLPDVVNTLKLESPQLEIELLSNNSHVNFARMEADLFVRPAMSLPEDMIAETAAHLVFRAFGTSQDLDKWLGLKGPLARSAAANWLSNNIPGEALGSGSDSFTVLSRMAQNGTGIAILPTFVGESLPNLVHLPDKMPDIRVPVWVGSHQDLRDIPRIRAVRKSVIAHLSAKLDQHPSTCSNTN